MEPTFKIVLDKRHPKADMTYPLKLRVYQGGIYKEKSLSISVPEKDWNPLLQEVYHSNANHQIYNTRIISVKTKIQKSILLNEEDQVISADEVVQRISRKRNIKSVQVKADILEYGKRHISKLQKSGNIGNSIAYSCAVNKLQEYALSDKLTFEQVDYSFLEGFNNSLLTEGLKVNSISVYLRSIRALFNKAIKEKIIEAGLYPFSSFKIRNERTINRTLGIQEMKSIADLNLPKESPIWRYRGLFLLSFCLIGINFSDLLTLRGDNFIDGRIIFRRRKTHKVYSIFMHPKASEILNGFMGKAAEGFYLPFVVDKNDPQLLKKDILQVIKTTNEYLRKIAKLCEIDKPVSTYYARYSWANIAKSQGYSKDMIAEALGHEYGNRVTGIYLDNYDNEIIDKMSEQVIKAVFT